MSESSPQRAYRAACPGCGAPVSFRSAQSSHAVCGYCQSTVVRNGEVIYERDQMFGGAQLTHQIARHYNLPFEEAHQRKKNADLPEDYARVVLPPFLEGLAQEVGRALQFFFTSTPHNKVEHILLSGGSAALPGLAAMVQLQPQFQCQIVQPFEGMLLGPAVKGAPLQRDATSYLVATGLAMRRFVS